MKDNLKPNHYHNDTTMEPFEIIKKDPEAWRGFCYGNIIKYVQRYQGKNGIEDLLKARVYLDELIKSLEDEKIPFTVHNPEPNKDVYKVPSNFNEDSDFALFTANGHPDSLDALKYATNSGYGVGGIHNQPVPFETIKDYYKRLPKYSFAPISIYSIVKDYKLGISIASLAEHYGVEKTTIGNVIDTWYKGVMYYTDDIQGFLSNFEEEFKPIDFNVPQKADGEILKKYEGQKCNRATYPFNDTDEKQVRESIMKDFYKITYNDLYKMAIRYVGNIDMIIRIYESVRDELKGSDE